MSQTAQPIRSRGPIGPDWPTDRVSFERYPPSPGLADLVRHFWLTEWRLPEGEALEVPALVYPACNVVIEPLSAAIHGPERGLSSKRLIGTSWAVGVLLTPAAGYLIAGRSLRGLVSGALRLDGPQPNGTQSDGTARSHADQGRPDDASVFAATRRAMTHPTWPRGRRHRSAIAHVEDWLAGFSASFDEEGRLIDRIAKAIEDDPSLIRVEQVAERFDLSRRSLERLVLKRIGLSPRWLLQRRRLQHGAQLIKERPDLDLSSLAHDLGYADYPHFSREFKAVVGLTPAAYRRSLTPASPA